MELVSLYDYLGRAAGPELGKQVASAAAARKIPLNSRYVETKTYTGAILLYPKSFLDEFFGGGANTHSGKQLLHG